MRRAFSSSSISFSPSQGPFPLIILFLLFLINIFITRGSFLIYRGFLQPLLCKHEARIDQAVANLWQETTWWSGPSTLSAQAQSPQYSSSKVAKEAGRRDGKPSCARGRRDCQKDQQVLCLRNTFLNINIAIFMTFNFIITICSAGQQVLQTSEKKEQWL